MSTFYKYFSMLRVAPSLQAMSTYKYFSMLRVAPSLQAMSTL